MARELKRQSRWFYQKRIEELERRLNKMGVEHLAYQNAIRNIYNGIIEVLRDNKSTALSIAFILNQIKPCLK